MTEEQSHELVEGQSFPGRVFRQKALIPPGAKEAIAPLINRIRAAGLIKDRTYHLKNYPNVMIGSECVQWFTAETGQTSEQIVIQMQTLVDGFVLHHVTDEHPIKADHLFYRLYEDEEGKSVAQLADSARKAGWVTQVSGMTSRRKTRYALLSSTTNTLLIFSNDISVSPSSELSLENCQMTTVDGALGIKVSTSSESVSFSLASSEDKDEWMNMLGQAGVIFDNDEQTAAKAAKHFFVLQDKDMNTQTVGMDQYKGKVCLITNVASK